MNPRTRLGLIGSSLALLLAACAQTPAPDGIIAATSLDDAYALTVRINANASKTALTQKYGGAVALFAPQAGFAVLKMSEAQSKRISGLLRNGEKLEKNKNRFSLQLGVSNTGISASGGGAWAHGGGAWATGGGAWASGGGAWASGGGAWANGAYIPFPNNTELWKKLQLDVLQIDINSLNIDRGVKVAIIDTGIDLTHPAFENKLVPAFEMKDYVDDDDMPQDEGVLGEGATGHGTSVAGIVLQIAPNAQLLPLRVLNTNGEGDTSTVAAAIVYAADHGAQVVNLSLGSADPSPAVTDAIRYATEVKGVFVVAAAGNENHDGASYPAAGAQESSIMGAYLIGVGSASLDDVKSSFSNYGRGVEVYALGEQVSSLAPGGRVASWTGTSQATPEVAGALALAVGSSKLNTAQQNLADVLTAQVDALGGTADAASMGIGRLNLKKFLESVIAR